MIRQVGQVLVLAGVIMMSLAFLPWLGCVLDFPGNLSELRIALGIEDLDATASAVHMCWRAYPATGERTFFAGGVGALCVGVLCAALGQGGARRADLPTHMKRELDQKRRPVEDKTHARNVTQRELEQGIEVDLEYDEELAGILRPERSGGDKEQGDARLAGRQSKATLMDQVAVQLDETRRLEELERDEHATIEGFYSPPGTSHLPVLYVDGAHERASGSFEAGRREQPFSTISEAIKRARRMVRESKRGVQIRVMPGVYRERLAIPPQVAVVNHHLPARGSDVDRFEWVRAQPPKERVELRAPPTEKIGVQCDPGGGQGIYGCHLVGQKKAGQVGIKLSRSERVHVVACVIEQFDEGGAYLEFSGSDPKVGGVRFHACAFYDNKALEGGAVAATESAVTIKGCVFERNRSARGGALCMWGMRGTVLIEGCAFIENKSQIKHLPTKSLEDISPETWEAQEGIGGALWIGSSKLKLVECDFHRNGASMSGGAIACIASRVVMQGGQARPMVFTHNRARSGGAICVVGGYDAESGSTVKMQHVECAENFGQRGGGALFATGGSTIQADRVRLEKNEGDETGSAGGGVYLLHGAELIGARLTLLENTASTGGGIASINASLRLKDQCIFRENVATFESCGGLVVGVRRHARLDEAIAEGACKLPFVLKLLDVEFVGNLAMDDPAAAGIGDMEEGRGSYPLGVDISDRVRLRANNAQGKALDHATHQTDVFQIVWREETRYASTDSLVKAQRLKLL